MAAITQLDECFWTVPAAAKLGGLLQLNGRMTVLRLADGGLVIHSPVAYTAALGEAVDALGAVHAFIAPSLLHHLHLDDWMVRYPSALSFVAPGLPEKRPEMSISGLLDGEFDARFGAELQRIPLHGMPMVNESLFFHRPSGALLATDFTFFVPQATGMTGLYASLMGFKQRPCCPLLFRLAIRDKAAFRASLEPLRELDIRHLSMCHHQVVSSRARETLDYVLTQLQVAGDGR
ncbi:MAG: hypothetical protein CMP23_06480 [Rickettsiales bacterium]|nr:hypothetical protein [Rickettsiales bacterium]|tara:strand:- start:592 stop:1293 length:702 start_codon:yes stop_codon:yes gene_type:complete